MEKIFRLISKNCGVLVLVPIIFGVVSVSVAGECPPPPPPPCEPLECRVTGGGVDSFDNWNGDMAYATTRENDGVDRYTFGGQAGAPTASQPQPYGEWTHHQQRGPSGSFIFHAGTASAPVGTEIDYVACSDPGTCTPSGNPPSPNKQIDFGGVGTFKNIRNPSPELEAAVVPGETFHWFRVHIEDLGEPGKNGRQRRPSPDADCPPDGSPGGTADCDCPDFYWITIFEGSVDPEIDTNNEAIYHVHGYIKGGNLQIHSAL